MQLHLEHVILKSGKLKHGNVPQVSQLVGKSPISATTCLHLDQSLEGGWGMVLGEIRLEAERWLQGYCQEMRASTK